MIKSYLTIAFRNMMRNKIASLINIFGLAVGISSCIFIFIFVRNEEGYDKKNPNADRIARVISNISLTGQTDKMPMSSFQLSPRVKAEYPEVDHAVRFMPIPRQTIWYGNQVFQLDNVCFTDSDFFRVFNYQFISGNSKTALDEPYSIVLTEESANTIFGNTENVLGKMLKFARSSYKVTGVIKAPKNETHLVTSAIISISSLNKPYAQLLSFDWLRLAQSNYIMFKNKEDIKAFQPKLTQFENKYINPFLSDNKVKGTVHLTLQPLKDIHLGNAGIHFEYADVGNKSYLYIFSMIAIFILLIACINYMNLATAKSAKRAKEVGIRKTAGADRPKLIRQFIGESLVITIISVLIALSLSELLLPFFNQLTDKALTINFADLGLLSFILGVILFVGVASGIYPAFFLSKFQPIQVLKTNNVPRGGNITLRKFLVVLQFSISIILIIGTLVVYLQMQYMKNKDVGFSKEQVYVLKTPAADSSFNQKFQELKNEFKTNPSVVSIAGSDQIPGQFNGAILQFVTYDNKKEERLMNFMVADYDYLPLLNIPIVKGRNFSKDFASDDTAAFIVNETAIKQFGWKDPLSVKMVNALQYNGHVIGVIRDFNYVSLHKPIEPLVITLSKRLPAFLLVKVKPENISTTVSFIDTKWKMFSKKYPLESFFLDDNFNKQYRADDKMLLVFAYFSALTIIIACLGLLALASFTTEQRTKEIGIRKVMGASIYNIVALLTKDFLKLVALAFIIASPIAWFTMNKWLQDFAYRINISMWIIAAAAFISFLVALLTVSYQAIKAALLNPAESVKYE